MVKVLFPIFKTINVFLKKFPVVVGFCVYVINTIIRGCLEIRNFSSPVQFDISLVRYAHS